MNTAKAEARRRRGASLAKYSQRTAKHSCKGAFGHPHGPFDRSPALTPQGMRDERARKEAT